MENSQPNAVLVTGSAGLVGSAIVRHFSRLGSDVHGVDNNERARFFGPDGDVTTTLNALKASCSRYKHHDLDIRDYKGMQSLLGRVRPDLVVHCAAQPSHDLAASMALDDFYVNTAGTLNLLQSIRENSPDTTFVFMSTNKVYGDKPNELEMIETESRWDYANPEDYRGIREDFSIDQSTHSLFGASKLSADIYVQEYGRYFGLKTCCLRGGCLTGAGQRGVKLHGFLSYLVRTAIRDDEYTIYGYKGKQVRDNIHAVDVARFIEEFYKAPRSGEVYNIGGGRSNSCSILEAIRMIEAAVGRPIKTRLESTPRVGDHICYISDISKAKAHFPAWDLAWDLEGILGDLISYWQEEEQRGNGDF